MNLPDTKFSTRASTCSATRSFSRRFSSSNCRSRASLTSTPPYLAFQREKVCRRSRLSGSTLARHSRFPFLQNPNNLLLRESALLHREFSSRLVIPENSHFHWTSFRGGRSQKAD